MTFAGKLWEWRPVNQLMVLFVVRGHECEAHDRTNPDPYRCVKVSSNSALALLLKKYGVLGCQLLQDIHVVLLEPGMYYSMRQRVVHVWLQRGSPSHSQTLISVRRKNARSRKSLASFENVHVFHVNLLSASYRVLPVYGGTCSLLYVD